MDWGRRLECHLPPSESKSSCAEAKVFQFLVIEHSADTPGDFRTIEHINCMLPTDGKDYLHQKPVEPGSTNPIEE